MRGEIILPLMDVKFSRKEKRAEFISRRVEIDAATRLSWNRRIDEHLAQGFPLLAGMVIGFCWPYKGEYDARFVIKRFRDLGAMSALPAVIAKKTPLEFRHWRPGFAMFSGAYGIPVPEASEIMIPDALIVPMIAFDDEGYRLGYGGGYFDITLAAICPRPIAIGVCYDAFKLQTLDPQPHDIRMDFVVTESGVFAANGERLVRLNYTECQRRASELARQRGLPRMQNPAHRQFSSPPCYANEVAPNYFGGETKN